MLSPTKWGLLLEEAAELAVEARNAAGAVQHLAVATGPSRVRGRVDVEVQGCTFFAVGRTGLVGGAISHHYVDEVVVRVRIGFHSVNPSLRDDDSDRHCA